MTAFSFRTLNILGLLGCVAGMAFALFLEHVRHFEPCPMCIFQRIAMIATGLVFLFGWIQSPRAGGRWFYALLATLTSAIGAGIAGRQVWLQHLPPDLVPACGGTLGYLMKMMPFTKLVEFVLKGEGSCAKIDAQWLGITLPEWTLFAFIGFAIFSLLMPKLARN